MQMNLHLRLTRNIPWYDCGSPRTRSAPVGPAYVVTGGTSAWPAAECGYTNTGILNHGRKTT